MERGIWRHGRLKTFLTRGIFRSIFRPLMYTREETIHNTFLGVIQEIQIKIHGWNINKDNVIILFWLTQSPKWFFETLFLPDENGNCLVPVLRESDRDNGEQCAYITQAYILFTLGHIFNNDKAFQHHMGLTIQDMEFFVSKLLGENHNILRYLSFFRKNFHDNLDHDEFIHPLDRSGFYVAHICRMVISDQSKASAFLESWGSDLMNRMALPRQDVDLISEHKDMALRIAERYSIT